MHLDLPATLVHALVWMQWFFFAYFIVLNLVYLGLNFVSAFSIHHYMRDHGASFLPESFSTYQPPEASTCRRGTRHRRSWRSAFAVAQKYPEFEIVIVTMDRDLPARRHPGVPAGEFPEAYRSAFRPRQCAASTRRPRMSRAPGLQGNGGKADALNAAQLRAYPLYCVIVQIASCMTTAWPASSSVLEDSTTVPPRGGPRRERLLRARWLPGTR